MTRAVAFTQAQVRRAVKAAESAGLRVVGVTVRPDGTFEIETRPMTTEEIDKSRPLVNLDDAVEIARCSSKQQFKLLVAEGIFPKAEKKGLWNKIELRVAAAAALVVNDSTTQYSEVYFLDVGDFVKIGFSTGTSLRIASLQTASPYEIKLIGAVPGSPRNEQALHGRFKHLHHRGEWFRKTPGLMAYIDWLLRIGGSS